MPDRPILFSAPMVTALLSGRKFQTRRLAYRQVVTYPGCPKSWGLGEHRGDGYTYLPTIWQKVEPGDRLWVREAWAPEHRCDATPGGRPYDPTILYRESDPEPTTPQWEPFRWRPSIHMFRCASRLTDIVTEVRLQRLQDISEEDARAEGVERPILPHWPAHPYGAAFRGLWNTLHKPGNRWEDNPEVCAISFEVQERNIDA